MIACPLKIGLFCPAHTFVDSTPCPGCTVAAEHNLTTNALNIAPSEIGAPIHLHGREDARGLEDLPPEVIVA